MKSVVRIKINLWIFLVLMIFLSLESSGQDSLCECVIPGTMPARETRQFGDQTRVITKCFAVKSISVRRKSSRALGAEILSQILGRTITVEDLEKNPELLTGLETGEVTIDGITINLPPLQQIKERVIEQNPEIFDLKLPENKFYLRRDLDGFQPAWDEYLKARPRENWNSTQTEFLMEIGNEYLQLNTPADAEKAIKIFDLIVERADSVTRFSAQLKLAEANDLAGKRKDAIRNYQRVLANPQLQSNPEIKIKVDQRLEVLRENP